MDGASLQFLNSGLAGGVGVILLTAGFIAVLAPLLLSISARSGISMLTASALLVAAAGTIMTGKTVIHEVLAAVLYLAALVSSSVIYAGDRIERAVRRG